MTVAMKRTVPGLAAALFLAAGPVAAQESFHACYIANIGAVYLIKAEGLPETCLAESHVEVSWSEGMTELPDGAVVPAKLADGSVLTAKLADAAVVAAKLAEGAVGTAALADGAVTSDKLAPDAIAGVADESITTAKLAPDAVTGDRVADGTLSTADLASNSVTAVEIATNAVGSSEIDDGTITQDDLATGTIAARAVAHVEVSEFGSITLNRDVNFSNTIGGAGCTSFPTEGGLCQFTLTTLLAAGDLNDRYVVATASNATVEVGLGVIDSNTIRITTGLRPYSLTVVVF